MKVGKRPSELRSRKKRSRLLTRVEKGQFKNVIHVARQYKSFLDRDDVVGYKQVAEHFGVTKASISQYLGILNRLPEDFIGWLDQYDDQALVAFFGKKRLNTIAKHPKEEHLRLLLVESRRLPTMLETSSPAYHELLEIFALAVQPRPREQRRIQLD